MTITFPHELLEGYGHSEFQLEIRHDSGLTWDECVRRIPEGDRFCVGLRGQTEMVCGGGVLHRSNGRLQQMGQILGSMAAYPIKMVLISFPNGQTADTPISVWAPQWVYSVPNFKSSAGKTSFNTRLTHEFDRSEWNRRVSQVKQSINKGVLSRQSRFDLSVSPLELTGQLFGMEPNGYRLYIETGVGQGFTSVSPERLIRVSNGTVETEAIAGTLPLGESDALLSSGKNRLEHDYVRDWIQTHLVELGLSPMVGEVELQPLSHVVHLRTVISAAVNDVDIQSLVERLFPTPAVAGVPQKDAVRLINELESPRGFYSGLLGMVTPEFSEFIVLIRYCEWSNNQYSVRTGAGIVHDSDPELEWLELNQKIKLFGAGE